MIKEVELFHKRFVQRLSNGISLRGVILPVSEQSQPAESEHDDIIVRKKEKKAYKLDTPLPTKDYRASFNFVDRFDIYLAAVALDWRARHWEVAYCTRLLFAGFVQAWAFHCEAKGKEVVGDIKANLKLASDLYLGII